MNLPISYRGRIAPSPTGFLHVGHAQTFWTARERATMAGGTLVFRNDDLDQSRVRPEFVKAQLEDLRWFGLGWEEGPDVGGAFGPYSQSERGHWYEQAWHRLVDLGCVYPCVCSRKDILSAVSAPHAIDDELIYPGTCRRRIEGAPSGKAAWRFRVPTGGEVQFVDERLGQKRFVGGRDFGDFVIWRMDGGPSYQLACVVDDRWMGITEVVRGEDLLLSTARQILLYEALGWPIPKWFHCPLAVDDHGQRLAKRHEALSLRTLMDRGHSPESIRAMFLNRDHS